MARLHFQLLGQPYRFHIKPGFMLMCAAMLVLFCYLGEWQVYRYHYKQQLVSSYEHNKASAPLPFATVKAQKDVLPFQRVAVEGLYQNNLTVLLQNKPYRDQMGFEVVTPLKVAGENALLLVDRGWVAGRDQIAPAIAAVTDFQHINGDIKLLNERQFILGNNILALDRSPLVMQKMDVKELEKVTHQSYLPYLLRLDAHAPNGFVRDWVITSMQPERHLGYAVQWFMMAAVLLIAYFCFCCEKLKRVNNANS